MTAEELFQRLQAEGIVLSRVGDRLRYRGPSERLTPELLEAMGQHKERLLELVVGPEVASRVEAFRKLVVPGRPLPYFHVRAVPFDRGQCMSCGEFKPQEEGPRCAACAQAARIVVDALQQRGHP